VGVVVRIVKGWIGEGVGGCNENLGNKCVIYKNHYKNLNIMRGRAKIIFFTTSRECGEIS
jgi:hypothetical protein